MLIGSYKQPPKYQFETTTVILTIVVKRVWPCALQRITKSYLDEFELWNIPISGYSWGDWESPTVINKQTGTKSTGWRDAVATNAVLCIILAQCTCN